MNSQCSHGPLVTQYIIFPGSQGLSPLPFNSALCLPVAVLRVYGHGSTSFHTADKKVKQV